MLFCLCHMQVLHTPHPSPPDEIPCVTINVPFCTKYLTTAEHQMTHFSSQMQRTKEVQGHERTRVCTEVKELVFCSCKDAEIASIKQSMRLTAI